MTFRLNLILSGLACCMALGVQAAESTKQGPMDGACKADVEALCQGVQPGGGRLAKCLREHKDKVSEGCKAAIKAHHAEHKKHRPGGEGGQGGKGDEADQ